VSISLGLDPLDRKITLNPGTTKNKEGRAVHMTQEVFELLYECVRGKNPEDVVFTRENKQPVRDFRDAWYSMCIGAGVGHLVCPSCPQSVDGKFKCAQCGSEWKRDQLRYDGLIFHDLRRSAVRNLVRSGVPERVAMAISGHKTRAVFDRYNIVSETDISEATQKLERRRRAENDKSTTKIANHSASVPPSASPLTQ
jgi:Phage integrase family